MRYQVIELGSMLPVGPDIAYKTLKEAIEFAMKNNPSRCFIEGSETGYSQSAKWLYDEQTHEFKKVQELM